MSEEEIIKIVTFMLDNRNTDIYVITNYEAIKGLLDLYQQEKKKNKRYEKYLKNKDKEHEKVLEYIETEKEEDYVSKDKIKEKIRMYYLVGDAVGAKILELLLEEER